MNYNHNNNINNNNNNNNSKYNTNINFNNNHHLINSHSNREVNYISRVKKVNIQNNSMKNIRRKIKNESNSDLSEIIKTPKVIQSENNNLTLIKVVPPEKDEKTERTTNINIINYNIFNNIPHDSKDNKILIQKPIHYNQEINLTPLKHNSNSVPKKNFNLSFNNTMSIIKSPSKLKETKEKKLNSIYSYSSINISKKKFNSNNESDLYKTFFKNNNNHNDIYNYNINTHFEDNKYKKNGKLDKINKIYQNNNIKNAIIYEDLEYSPPQVHKIKHNKIYNKNSINSLYFSRHQKNKAFSYSIYGNFDFRKNKFSLPILKKRGSGYI